MTRNVNGGDLLVQDLRAGLRELVDGVVHSQLVTGDGLRRDDDRVAALDMNRGMVVVSDPRQRGERFSLAARAEDELFVRLELVEVDGPHEHPFGHVHVPQVARDVRVLPHRAPDDAHLAVQLDRDVDGLLHAVDVRGKGRDEDPALP